MARKGSSGILGAGGGFGTGLLLLLGGLVVKNAEANEVAACSSDLGRFGQALDPNAASSCSAAQGLSTAASAATWIGGIMLVFAVGGFVIFLIALGAEASKKGSPARSPGTGKATPPGPARRAGVAQGAPGRSARPRAAESPASFPAVSFDMPGGGNPQSAIPRSGCGHELRPGARFCVVCGHPTGDDGPPAISPEQITPPVMTDDPAAPPVVGPASSPQRRQPDLVAPAAKSGRHRVSR